MSSAGGRDVAPCGESINVIREGSEAAGALRGRGVNDVSVADYGPAMGGKLRAYFTFRHRLVALAVVVFAVGGVFFATVHSPHLPHTSLWNAVFDSRLLIAGARLVLVVGGLFLLASCVVATARGEWARVFGPVSINKQKAADADDLREQLVVAQDTIKDLQQQIARSSGTSAELRKALAHERSEVARMRRERTNPS